MAENWYTLHSSISSRRGVEFVHPSLRRLIPQYEMISDCLEGEARVKSRAEYYLPDPSPANERAEIRAKRYSDYIYRAVFYGVSRYTMNGLLGQIFSKPVEKTFPAELELVIDSPSGDGVGIDFQAKATCEAVLAHSRAGLLVDFPSTDGGATAEQVLTGVVRPTITLYSASDITNWRVEDIGAEEVLTLVVLRETQWIPQIMADDGKEDDFGLKPVIFYRVLRLVDGRATVELWEPDTQAGGAYRVTEAFPILDHAGRPFNRIPFRFLGLSTNAIVPASPAFIDLCSLNLAHYRNSADYEEACFMVGQPTPVVSGLTNEWYEKTLNGQIRFGSRGGIPLPEGGAASLLQMQPNDAILEAMRMKEAQMRAIGAKLIESNDTQKTATESRIDATSEGGILASAAKNVSAGYLWALKECCKFLGIDDSEITFELNSDFDITKLSADERREIVAAWQAGILAKSDVYRVYKRGGIATLPFEEAEKEIEKQQTADLEYQAELTKAVSQATDPGAV
ncbi:portal protein [Caudoviricetes sp.]|nr:portal protein [Caudoviricetes sp.]